MKLTTVICTVLISLSSLIWIGQSGKSVLPFTQQPEVAFPNISTAPSPSIGGNIFINQDKTLLYLAGIDPFNTKSYQVYDLIERKPYNVAINTTLSCDNVIYSNAINNILYVSQKELSDNTLTYGEIFNMLLVLVKLDLSTYKSGTIFFSCQNMSSIQYNLNASLLGSTTIYNRINNIDWIDIDQDGYAEVFMIKYVLFYNKNPGPYFVSNGASDLYMLDTKTNIIYNSSQFLSGHLISQVYSNTTLDFTYIPNNAGTYTNFNDYNNDGKIDILIVYTAYGYNSSYPTSTVTATAIHNNWKIYIQTVDKTFIDSTSLFHIPTKAVNKFYEVTTSPITSFDYNKDSLVDLLITTSKIVSIYDYFILLKQLQNHTFTDVTSISFDKGIPPSAGSNIIVKDFNNDGLPDLYFNLAALSGGYFPNVYIQDNNGRFNQISSTYVFPDINFGIGILHSALLYDINQDGLVDALFPATVGTKGYTITTLIQGCGRGYYIDATRFNVDGCILCQGTVSSDQFSCNSCTGLDYYNSTSLGCTACPTDPPSIPETDRLSCRACPDGQVVENGFCVSTSSGSSSSDSSSITALVGGLIGGFGLLGFILLSCLICILLCCCGLLVICLLVVIAVIIIVPLILGVSLFSILVPSGAAGFIGYRKWRNRPKLIQLEEITIVKLLGEGAFGQVFLGTCRGDLIAVKKITVTNVKLLEEFRHEVDILSQLSHPFVIRYIGSIEKEDFCYILTGYAEGGSLDKIQGSLSYEDKIRIIQESAEAMVYLHSQGVIHRDISCRNILLDQNNHAIVADFGMSRVLKDIDMDGAQTKNTVGPIRWLPPEFLREHRYSRAGDVYMFGMMVYELLSNQLPFYQTANIIDVANMVINGSRPTIPSNWDDKIVRLLQDCWRERPEERPIMEQIVERLDIDRERLYADFQESSYISADGLG